MSNVEGLRKALAAVEKVADVVGTVRDNIHGWTDEAVLFLDSLEIALQAKIDDADEPVENEEADLQDWFKGDDEDGTHTGPTREEKLKTVQDYVRENHGMTGGYWWEQDMIVPDYVLNISYDFVVKYNEQEAQRQSVNRFRKD